MLPVITGVKKRVNKYTFIKIRVAGRHQRQSVCGESESVVRTRTVFVTARIQTRYEHHEFLWWALSSPNSSRSDGSVLIFGYLCRPGRDAASCCYVRGMIGSTLLRAIEHNRKPVLGFHRSVRVIHL